MEARQAHNLEVAWFKSRPRYYFNMNQIIVKTNLPSLVISQASQEDSFNIEKKDVDGRVALDKSCPLGSLVAVARYLVNHSEEYSVCSINLDFEQNLKLRRLYQKFSRDKLF